jgi:hypothetical protein
MLRNWLLLLPVALLVISGCSSGPNTESDPRKVVLKAMKAIENNDRATLAHYLDFETLLKHGERDYALKTDTPRVFNDPEQILDDLLEGGLTNSRWQALQRVVGSASQQNDSALVEVSFINKETDTQYYNKFGLRKINDVWKIYSFSAKDR